MAALPAESFIGYNPFLVRNAYECFDTFSDLSNKEFLRRAMLRRGMIFHKGERLTQVYRLGELATCENAFWVEDPGLRIHFRLPGDSDPSDEGWEITTREQVFAPHRFGLGFIRISGIHFAHAADGLPVPQRACVSASRGHHWIVETCRIEWANAVGLDIGAQHWSASVPESTGRHIIRGNTIRNCGICGIAGALGVHHSLIEANTIEYIGHQNLERSWECAGLKFHLAEHCLFRRNVFRHICHAGGIWLDCRTVNNRVTNNVFADIETLSGAVYSEVNYYANMVDHNLIWDIRVPKGESHESKNFGSGLHCDSNEKMVAAYNLFGRIEGGAAMFSLIQGHRKIDGRTGLCRSNSALNNIFYRCNLRVHLGRREENLSDGNLFHAANDDCSFQIAYPEPGCHQNLVSWQEYFGLDTHSTQARLEFEFNVETLVLKWNVQGDVPECQSVAGLTPLAKDVPGPLKTKPWDQSLTGETGRQRFPMN